MQRHALGVCSWSLRPHSPGDLVRSIRATGVVAVQLALDPIARGVWKEDETFGQLRAAGIGVLSAMLAPIGEDYSTLDTIRLTGGVRPDATWPANLRAAHKVADICARHAIGLCTFHAGHVPAEAAERARLIGRLAEMARAFVSRGVRVAFETGQETAADQLRILDELRRVLGPAGGSVGLNFDPANIILYGVGEPLRALDVLKGEVRQVHVKDATRATAVGIWGEEVPAGTGHVPWPGFLAAVHAAHPGVALVIEREAGEDRIGDVRRARDLVRGLLGASMDMSGGASEAGATHG